MTPRSREEREHGRESKRKDQEDANADGVVLARVETAEVVEDVDWDDQEDEYHGGDDCDDKALDARAGVVDFFAVGFLLCLLDRQSCVSGGCLVDWCSLSGGLTNL